MARLSVNVDHVATLRQARLAAEPDPVTAATLVEIAGADGITVHLREDRRHIQDRDLIMLKKMIKTSLNLEMAATPEMLKVALTIKPEMITVVPEKRKELTTEGGLDLRLHRGKDQLKRFIASLKDAGIIVNLFIDPDPEQIRNAHKLGSNGVEIHTGRYADKKDKTLKEKELKRIYNTAVLADRLGMAVHAGHGLDYQNVSRVVQIEEIKEFAIGFSIIARSVIVGIERAVKDMLELVR
ncbi:MAG: pyridoxine 5'-phosphate synthase [Thermodesulfobacteriota bacterium]